VRSFLCQWLWPASLHTYNCCIWKQVFLKKFIVKSFHLSYSFETCFQLSSQFITFSFHLLRESDIARFVVENHFIFEIIIFSHFFFWHQKLKDLDGRFIWWKPFFHL
jgi:hypothetical protein